MSISSRQAAGWVARAAWYQEHGYDINTMLDAWGGYDAGEDSRTLFAIWNQGGQAANAGLISQEDFANGTVPASLIPGRGPGRNNYRYRIVGTYAPSDGGPVIEMATERVSAFQLTGAQIEQVAIDDAPAFSMTGTPQKRRLHKGVIYTLQSFRIESLERWQV